MKILGAVGALALLTAPAVSADEVPFEPSAESFSDAASCKLRLIKMIAAERAQPHVAVEGPYDIAPGDVRAHWVDTAGSGHRITEHRCLVEKLSGRSWRHAVDDAEPEKIETIDDMAAKAEWLKKAPAEQK